MTSTTTLTFTNTLYFSMTGRIWTETVEQELSYDRQKELECDEGVHKYSQEVSSVICIKAQQ